MSQPKFSQAASDIAFKHSQGIILPHGVNGLAADIDALLLKQRADIWAEAIEIVDIAGNEWGDRARKDKSKTYSSYAIAALDIHGQLQERQREQENVNELTR